MNRQQRVAHVVALVVIGVCAVAAPMLAQDCPEPVDSGDRPGCARNVAQASAQANQADIGDLEGDGAAPEAAGMAFNPQIVIWSDALTNLAVSAAQNTLHDEFMVGWTTEQDQWSSDIWARRLRPDGTLFEHFNVANAAGEWLEGPEIEYCSLHDEYLIAYTNYYDQSYGRIDVQARRVAWNGGWMSDIFTITPGVAEHLWPSVAYCAPCDEYVVTYGNQWPSGVVDIYAQRIRAADGALLDMNTVASDVGWYRTHPRVAFHQDMYGGAGGYLIAYLAIVAPQATDAELRYKITHTELYDLFVNPELEVATTTGPSAPQVDAGETGFLVAWWEMYPGGTRQVRARRIGAAGIALGQPEGFPVSGAYSTYTYRLAVTYAYPGLYLVLWEQLSPALIWEIHGIFVSEEADATVGEEFVLSGTGSNIVAPDATCSPMSDCLIAYQWWNPPSYDIAGEIVRLIVIFADGFESGDTSAWSTTVP